MGGFTIIIIALVLFQIFSFIATWRLFKLAGEESWKAAVPIYSQFTMIKIIERPKWWILLILIPATSPIMLLIIYADFIRVFGKRSFLDILLTLFLGLFYIAYVNYDKQTEYEGVEKRVETLVASLMFAVVLAFTIHTYLLQPMIVPTGSLENTIRIGDALIVEKISYGSRIPMTQISVPFSDIFYRKAYLKELQLPYMRLPGWRKLKRNDIVVFNYPADSVHVPIDRKDPYVKRLIALPGDTLEIDSTIVYVNGKEFIPKKDAVIQHSFVVESKIALSEKYLQREFELVNTPSKGQYNYRSFGKNAADNYIYFFTELSDEHVKKMSANKNVVSIKPDVQEKGKRFDSFKPPYTESDSANVIFPVDKPWNRDYYGPLYVPKKGDKITLNKENLGTYFNLVNKYEKNNVQIKNNQIFVDGKVVDSHEYEIQQDYFMLMGDNRHNSTDPRHFGFVPEQNIVGRPILLWANMNQIFGFEKRQGWHWDRWFTVPNNDNPNKTSYRWYVFILLGIYFAWDYYRARKKKQKEQEE